MVNETPSFGGGKSLFVKSWVGVVEAEFVGDVVKGLVKISISQMFEAFFQTMWVKIINSVVSKIHGMIRYFIKRRKFCHAIDFCDVKRGNLKV